MRGGRSARSRFIPSFPASGQMAVGLSKRGLPFYHLDVVALSLSGRCLNSEVRKTVEEEKERPDFIFPSSDGHGSFLS